MDGGTDTHSLKALFVEGVTRGSEAMSGTLSIQPNLEAQALGGQPGMAVEGEKDSPERVRHNPEGKARCAKVRNGSQHDNGGTTPLNIIADQLLSRRVTALSSAWGQF